MVTITGSTARAALVGWLVPGSVWEVSDTGSVGGASGADLSGLRGRDQTAPAAAEDSWLAGTADRFGERPAGQALAWAGAAVGDHLVSSRERVVSDAPDSPDLAIAKCLLDHLKLQGFQFRRVAPGEDAALVGLRVRDRCLDFIHIEGFSRDCFAWRKQVSPLIVPGDGLMEHHVHGHAITVLNEVLMWDNVASR